MYLAMETPQSINQFPKSTPESFEMSHSGAKDIDDIAFANSENQNSDPDKYPRFEELSESHSEHKKSPTE